MEKEKRNREYFNKEAAIGLQYGGELVSKWAYYYKVKWIFRGILLYMFLKWILMRFVL